MGREIKRVPLDFAAPKDRTWEGYTMPDDLSGEDCPDCGGGGYSPRAKYLHDLWYGYAPFRPEDNGSIPLTPETPAVRAFAERNVKNAPEFYGTGEYAIWREAQRLADLWNGQWSHHLNQQDVDALLDSERGLPDLTHTWTREDGWQPKDPPVRPTVEEVNEWSIRDPFSGGSMQWTVMKARLAREGEPDMCARCEGHGSLETYPGQRADADAWERTEPPTGEGWQMWQTVSDAPLSPVFATAEELIEWMTTPAAEWGASGPWSRENAEAFVRGPGWAPTFVSGVVPGLLVDGVTAVTQI